MKALDEIEWMNRAECLDVDLTVFFPETPHVFKDAYKIAREYCESCPVREECLEWAVSTEAETSTNSFGMYGGRTPEQRRAIRRERRRKVVA